MRFGISLEIDSRASENSSVVQTTDELLRAYFESRSYGIGIDSIYVGFICVESKPGFEKFFQPRRPRYVVDDKVEMLDGSVKSIGNTYSYDIKVPDNLYEDFAAGDKSVAFAILKTLLIESISNFENLKKRGKKFEVDKFKRDLVNELNDLEARKGFF